MVVNRIPRFDERKLTELYEEVKSATNNFNALNSSVLAENSQRVLIFRLALKMSSEKFAKMCKRTHGSIENLERSPKKLNLGVAEYYINSIKGNIEHANFQLNEILQTFKKFRERFNKGVKVMDKKGILKFAKLGARKSVESRKENEEKYFKASLIGVTKQPLTNQERKIRKILDGNKILYKLHEFVGGENLDFVIENDGKKILIGCSSSNSKNLVHHARRLMYQGYRVKYKLDDNVIFVGILGKQDGRLKRTEVPLGASKLLTEICDSWFVDDELDDMINFIKTGS